MKLVLASNNAKKLAELQALLAPLGLFLSGQGDLGVGEAEEPHCTFIENALVKARQAAAVTGLPAIADDSGLCVDALGGAPGVLSATFAPLPKGGHFAGPAEVTIMREDARALQDAVNNAFLLERLTGIANRRAAFCCTLVALRAADDPQPLIASGRWEGTILESAQGDGGFGYDPLMFIPVLGTTVAALPAAVKNTLSHRALAAARMRDLIRQMWL